MRPYIALSTGVSIALIAALLAGCGGSKATTYTEGDGRPIAPEPQDPEPGHGTPGAQDATGGKVDVPIRGRRFTARSIHVKVGQIVVFTNDDDVPHTVRADSGGLPHSGLIPVKGRFEYTPLVPGIVGYHCIVHPRMHGELVVTAAAR